MTDVLQLIDRAIEDYSVSDDAMRWRPEPRFTVIDEVHVWRDWRDLPDLTGQRASSTEDWRAANPALRPVQFVEQTVRVELTPEQRELVGAVFIDTARAFGLVVRQVVEAVTELARQFQAAGLIPPPAPVDPMQRALEARRNRNTGPAAPRRAPRRIDPRRVR